MLPDKVEIKGKVITIKEYCDDYCPQRHNSECWSDCDLSREIDEEDDWMDEDYFDDGFYEDDV
jgi:hypothetical protein